MMRFFRLHNFKKIILAMNLVRCYNLKRKDYDLKKSTNNNEKTTLFLGQCLNFFIVLILFYNIQKEVLSFKENKLERISIDEKLY